MKLRKIQRTVFGRLEPWCWRSEGDGRAPASLVGEGNVLRRGQIAVSHIYLSLFYCNLSPPQEGMYMHMYRCEGGHSTKPVGVQGTSR